MGDKRVLKMSSICGDEHLVVEVADIDTCLVLDLYMDLLEGAAKKRMKLPKFPTLHYIYDRQSCQLLSDEDVMKMFDVMKDIPLIPLAIGSTDTPCLPLQLARGLIDSKKVFPSTSVSQPSVELLVPSSQPPPIDLPHAATVSENETITHDNSLVRTQPSIQSVVLQRKMPATTAKRKGLYVTRSIKSHSISSEPIEGSCRRKRGRNHDFNASGDADFIDDDPVEDEDYEPLGSTDDEYSESSSMGEDMLEEDDHSLVVDNEYEPYKSDAWDVEDEDYFGKMYKNGEMYPDYEFGQINLREWMLFTNRKHFKKVLKDYCIQEGFCVVVTHAEGKRYTAKCSIADCEWHIHASRLPDDVTWAIKSLQGDHSCSRLEEHNPMATPNWAAKKVVEDVRENIGITGKDLNKIFLKRYGVELKKSSLYKARDIALAKIQGGHDTSYGKLPMYCEMVKVKHPGSKAQCTWKIAEDLPEKPLQFKDIFISFTPQINGFIHGCRGLIGVDGTHLKGNHGGVLLCAIGLDGQNELFPLAYGVYDNESKRTWSQFFWHLKDCLKDSQREDWTIISDRQKGVEPALQDVWPSVSRRFCCRHLCANFKKSYSGPLMHKLFWGVCNAYSEFTFIKAYDKLKKEAGPGAIKWLEDLGDMESWARHKFNPALCCDENTSNFVESFNSTLGAHRCSPVLTLLDEIRRDCMVKHVTKQQEAESWDANGIVPKVIDLLKVARKDSRTCKVHVASTTEAEVRDGHSCLPVSLRDRTCACGQWQISGIPCRHAIKAILHLRELPTSYVSSWYSVQTYKQAYAMNFSPMGDSKQWPQSDLPQIHPPTMKRRIGRPSRNRRREDGEKRKGKRSGTVQCRKCKAFGHNSRTCKGGLTAREVREQQGQLHVQEHKRGKKSQQPIAGHGEGTSHDDFRDQ